MENYSYLQDELNAVQEKLDSVIDQMIEKYGKFVTLSEAKHSDDKEELYLAQSYKDLLTQKDIIVRQINLTNVF
jgi:hypothetical protein